MLERDNDAGSDAPQAPLEFKRRTGSSAVSKATSMASATVTSSKPAVADDLRNSQISPRNDGTMVLRASTLNALPSTSRFNGPDRFVRSACCSESCIVVPRTGTMRRWRLA